MSIHREKKTAAQHTPPSERANERSAHSTHEKKAAFTRHILGAWPKPTQRQKKLTQKDKKSAGTVNYTSTVLVIVLLVRRSVLGVVRIRIRDRVCVCVCAVV